jgi:hypothetical protein
MLLDRQARQIKAWRNKADSELDLNARLHTETAHLQEQIKAKDKAITEAVALYGITGECTIIANATDKDKAKQWSADGADQDYSLWLLEQALKGIEKENV